MTLTECAYFAGQGYNVLLCVRRGFDFITAGIGEFFGKAEQSEKTGNSFPVPEEDCGKFQHNKKPCCCWEG